MRHSDDKLFDASARLTRALIITEILLVGTGRRGLFPPPAFKKHLNSLGIQVDVLDSVCAEQTGN